ncbi:toxin-antitoxin system YwqK [Faustovirus]|nr:toxin-antitoxin system YwqK [Faustovirus]
MCYIGHLTKFNFAFIKLKFVCYKTPKGGTMSTPKKPQVLIEEFEHGKCESEITSTDGRDIIKHGPSKTWLKSRLVLSEHYKHGKRDGLQTKYYTNGDVYKTVNWVDGVKHGDVCVNLENGNCVKYTNVNGEISGPKYTWNARGDLIECVEFD